MVNGILAVLRFERALRYPRYELRAGAMSQNYPAQGIYFPSQARFLNKSASHNSQLIEASHWQLQITNPNFLFLHNVTAHMAALNFPLAILSPGKGKVNKPTMGLIGLKGVTGDLLLRLWTKSLGYSVWYIVGYSAETE